MSLHVTYNLTQFQSRTLPHQMLMQEPERYGVIQRLHMKKIDRTVLSV